jgi:GNAT superfamily N-acetyltransferase
VNYQITAPELGKSAHCTPILRALPDWFGIEEALQSYSAEIDRLPTLLARVEDQTVGFLSLKLHNPYAAEVYVMGIRQEMHRQGIGKALMTAAQEWLRAQNIEYLQVKTLSPAHPDAGYARTRAFYLALGFRPLEEFKQLWDEHNPCLIFIKRL